MPTRGGLLLGGSSVLAGVGGRLLGLRELFLMAAGGGALLMCALIYVQVRRFALHARRRLVPGRLAVGGSCRVELAITNRGRRRSPVLELYDAGHGRFLLDPLDRGEETRAVYVLSAERRGLVEVGPLRVRLRDPFGLASRRATVLAPSTLTVHPRIDHVGPPPDPPGTSIVGGPRQATLSPRSGGDFHALRPYEEGDDLRLVHWPTSARLDALVVRQEEAPRLRQTAVALDLRSLVHDRETLERAVSAAASVAAAACGDDGLVRLVTTGGADTGSAGGEAHLDSVLDLLAGVVAESAAGLGAMASALADSDGATVVLITTNAATADDLGLIARLRPHCPVVVAVVFERAAVGPARPTSRVGFDAVATVGAGAPFSEAWERAVSSALVSQ